MRPSLKLKESFQAHPHNKVWPSIPRFDQFRPIISIILSPMIKFIELRFYRKLLNYLKWDLDREPDWVRPELQHPDEHQAGRAENPDLDEAGQSQLHLH